jgi:Lsr2
MASNTTVELLDDIDGKAAAETITFGLDGRTIEIDLSEKHAKALRKDLARFVEAARKTSGSRARTVRVETAVDTKAVRLGRQQRHRTRHPRPHPHRSHRPIPGRRQLTRGRNQAVSQVTSPHPPDRQPKNRTARGRCGRCEAQPMRSASETMIPSGPRT